MELDYQKSALQQLEKLHESDSHSILIEGARGSGKTFIAQEFARMKGVSTFHSVKPRVSDLKELIDSSLGLQDKQVICIENLDDGVNAAAQVILKYLEEPLPNTYIVVTCINLSKLPSTIVSRAIAVKMAHPTVGELQAYGSTVNTIKHKTALNYAVYSVCKSLGDIRNVLSMSIEQLQYYESLFEDSFWSRSLDQVMWDLGHYENNDKTDLRLVLLCVMKAKSQKLRKHALEALLALENSNMSETAILGKFVLDVQVGR